jgi:hypothetical protein
MTAPRSDQSESHRGENAGLPTGEALSRVAAEFERRAAESQPSLVVEFWDFLRHNKKWWLTPIIAILLLVGMAVLLLNTGAAPFIYTLF